MKNTLELQKDTLKQYNNLFDISERKALIAETLKDLRLAADLTQKDLAELIGINTGTYSTYENGTRETPVEILVRLSLLFGIPIDIIVQKERFSKEKYLADKQIDGLQDELDELKALMTGGAEINPEAKELLQNMSECFSTLTRELSKLNNSTNPPQNFE